MPKPIAIVGGGIAGACLAYRLALAGHSVLLIDDGRPGRATGWNPGGINPLHGPGFPGVMEGFYRDAYRLHAEQWRSVADATGIDFGWRVVDRLFLALDDKQAEDLRRYVSHYEQFEGFSARWMHSGEVADWDPRISSSWVGGLITRGNVRVDAERYRLALLAAGSQKGVRAVSGQVQRVKASRGHIAAIDLGDTQVEVSALCMVTGSWDGEGIDGWEPGTTVSITPSIGDLLLVRSSEPGPRADISHGLTAIYAHDHDYFWVGGTARRDGPVGETTDEIVQGLLAGARSLLPGWGTPRVIAASSAARPSTDDGLPVIGRAPSYENGWIINGLGGKGILLSAWAAQSLVDMIEAGDDVSEFSAVSPRRITASHG